MKILFVAATRYEIEPLFKYLKIKHQSASFFYSKKFAKNEFNILITGTGMVSTAYHLGIHLFENDYDLVINAGIGGSFRKDISPGNIVNVHEECFADLGIEDDETFIPIIEMNFEGPDDFPLRKNTLVNTSEINSISLLLLPQVKGITVNTVHGNDQSIEKVTKLFNPDVESMEGAAFFYVCNYKNKNPFIEIRAISNYVERRDKSNWKTNEAINNLSETLKTFIEEIGEE
ncbi:MAG: futalosine hydrolase [Bacteroidia bacterium]